MTPVAAKSFWVSPFAEVFSVIIINSSIDKAECVMLRCKVTKTNLFKKLFFVHYQKIHCDSKTLNGLSNMNFKCGSEE